MDGPRSQWGSWILRQGPAWPGRDDGEAQVFPLRWLPGVWTIVPVPTAQPSQALD